MTMFTESSLFLVSEEQRSCSKSDCVSTQSSTKSSSNVLSEALVLPHPVARAKGKGKPALKSKKKQCVLMMKYWKN